ncbi:uncharacterized protein K452DRAFT_297992 [Aplosporella prunicola CBS 121167]|uniref:Uncharacterized protein n=1 Tax=Aplosporella prunicola CBS 121167 TaxID=1176127 RepID=A0A6A6BF08_9PEZI|nr:uncharacterized protein K452DRAFT_297992 [Aplosporella prunicola CBS 121167]KAF2141963.1 hypothetical protein K452DRAFT_297992 [Aplosporella prunicola CBS 121167]
MSNLDSPASPGRPRASSAAIRPETPRSSHGYASSVNEYPDEHGDHSFAGGGGGNAGNELGNLADELADADEDEYEYEGDEGDEIITDADLADPTHANTNANAQGSHGEHVSSPDTAATPRGSLLMSPKSTSTLSPPSRARKHHRRNQSKYDGSDYGDDSDFDSEGISPGLEKRMAEVESLARRGMEENGSANDAVVMRLTEQLKDLGSQAGVESGATRLITAHTALTTHLTHQTRLLTSLTSSLLSPLSMPPSPEDIDTLLPLLTDTLTHLPTAPPTPLHALATLTHQTHDLLQSLSYLADSLHMGRQTSNVAQRRLKVVREALGEWRRESELREEGVRWIERGGWQQRLEGREAAKACSDVVGGFEEVCAGWRQRLVAVGGEEVAA